MVRYYLNNNNHNNNNNFYTSDYYSVFSRDSKCLTIVKEERTLKTKYNDRLWNAGLNRWVLTCNLNVSSKLAFLMCCRREFQRVGTVEVKACSHKIRRLVIVKGITRLSQWIRDSR